MVVEGGKWKVQVDGIGVRVVESLVKCGGIRVVNMLFVGISCE